MIDLEVAKYKISDWIINFLDIPQESLNNIAPCPFAKQALLSNKIKFVSGTSNIIEDMLTYHNDWDNTYEAIAIVYSKDTNVNELCDCVDHVNSTYYITSGLIALEDHPDKKENIANLNFNNNEYALILIQQAIKLKKASEILKRKDYYKNWTYADLENVVNWRW